MTSLTRIMGSMLCLGLAACSKTDNDPKKSSDFATDAIDAFYYFEIDEDNKVGFRVNFENDDRSLELDDGDNVEVAGGVETHSLTAVKSGSVVNYVANVDEGSLTPSNYQFKFVRENQEDSLRTFGPVPIAFDLTGVVTDGVLTPTDGRYIDIGWDNNAESGSRFDLKINYNCSRVDGGSAINSSKTLSDIGDDGSYRIDLVEVLGSTTSQTCNDFDVIALRVQLGLLDLTSLKGGSISGAQVRQALNMTLQQIDLE